MPTRRAEVMIVDDESDVCWALSHILKECGFDSVSAGAGEQAVALAQRHEFGLVFVDAKLPDVDGIELAKRLSEANPDLPIVLISGYYYRDDAEVQRAIAGGVIRGFVSKPFKHDEVRRIVSRTLG